MVSFAVQVGLVDVYSFAGLSDEHLAATFKAGARRSYDGWCFADQSMKISWCNQQFCDLLEVTPAEVLEKRFVDITPEPFKTEDLRNAQLILQGKNMEGYMMEKDYVFGERRLRRTLLVVGVFVNGEFSHFFSRITMPAENGALPVMSPLPEGSSLLEILRRNWTVMGAVAVVVGWGFFLTLGMFLDERHLEFLLRLVRRSQ